MDTPCKIEGENNIKTFLSMCESHFDDLETTDGQINEMFDLMDKFENEEIQEALETLKKEYKWYKQDKPIF